MWKGDEDFNEDGQPVRLYHPIQYGQRVSAEDPTASFIGGPANSGRQCPSCGLSLLTLAQLHIKTTERTWRVLACNSASCFRSLFATSKFHFGGGGVVVCERVDAKKAESGSHVKKADESVRSSKKTEPVNDWDVSAESADNDNGLDDLEAKLMAMETSNRQEKSMKSPHKSLKKNTNATPGLPIMALASMQEPHAFKSSSDPRDVGLHGTSNKKIEDMLARYMQEEEDEDIVQMLKGTMSGGGGAQETDKDLTEEEMAVLRFSDRLKRAPRQVLRYAHGGEPLWSIPSPNVDSTSAKRKSKEKTGSVEAGVPPCSCGDPRVFEFQVLPTVLHILNVDKHANKNKGKSLQQLDEWYTNGGMDFGSIAVYACPQQESCPADEDFVVVQDTTEDQPEIPLTGLKDVGDVVVDEKSADRDSEDDGEEDQ